MPTSLRRLLMTLVVLVGGLWAAFGGISSVLADMRESATASHLEAADVGNGATSHAITRVARNASPHRAGLFSFISHALADADDGPPDELETDDSPDLIDDDCPQGFAVIGFAGLPRPAEVAPSVPPNLFEIQPSTGHPLGVDEPPRI